MSNNISEQRTDEEIINMTNYNFTLNIDTLINSSKTTQRLRNSPPRPQNPFLLYRRDKAASPECSGLKISETSKKIGEMWENESNEVKEMFNALARLADKFHSKPYFNYSYSRKKNYNFSNFNFYSNMKYFLYILFISFSFIFFYDYYLL
ncbi:hypothetical protein C1645_877759 [Glomus cerebriforme]|uniref:HMG box domain-containing protein n=1 Tax=Glomus cerebriforme TaxID=658196 RepID=A0A397SP53_9GLOM|nr:hypothetical protein C1645_877759 [Glomus cerebriforme]